MEESVFMVFGLGFFLFVIAMILRDDDRGYNRRLNEKREFGVGIPETQSRRKTRNK